MARTILGSTTMSVGPPIISRCSTLSRRTSTSRRRPSTAAASITASRGIRAAIGVGTEPVAGESADQPGRDADQRQDGHECEEECKCLHALSPANRVSSGLWPPMRTASYRRTANEASKAALIS